MDCKVNNSMKFLLKKQVVLRGLTLILIITIVSACGQATPPNSNQTDGTGNVTIPFADMNLDEGVDYQALADAFHRQNPAITVQVLPVDHTVQLAQEDIAKQADVVYLNGYSPAISPGFISLQPLIDAGPAGFNREDYWPGSTAPCADAQGNLYGLPLTLSSLGGIYYDPQVFDQAGVAYPQPGWTWEQFRQTIAQVSGTNDLGNTLFGFVDGPLGWVLQLLLEKQLLANDGKLDPQAVAAGLDWYVQLADEQKLSAVPPPDQQGGWTGNVLSQPVRSGQAAMWVDSVQSEMANPLVQGGKYTPYPVDAADDRTTPVSVACGAISVGSKAPQAAWAWLAFLSKQDLTGSADSGLLPARTSLMEASPFWSSLSAEQKSAMTYGLKHAFYFPAGQVNSQVLNAAFSALTNAIHDGTDLAAALQPVAALADTPAQATPTLEPFTIDSPAATPAANLQTITFNAAYGAADMPSEDTLKALIDQFEKGHPDIQVKLAIGFNGSQDGYAFRAMANQADCFALPSPDIFVQPLSDDDLLDLTPFLDASPDLKNDFQPAFLAPYQQNGRTYALPSDIDIDFFAYNEDLLSQLGISFPNQGWTFDEMLALAEQVVAASLSQSVYGLAAGNDLLLDATGVRWYDNTTRPPQALFTSSDVANGLAWLEQLYQQRTWLPAYGSMLPPERKPANYPGYEQAIADGQVAMWTTDGLRAYDRNLSFKVGYVPLPSLASGAPMSSYTYSQGYYISSRTKYPQACWEWIRFLSDQPGLFGGYSPRLSILEKGFAEGNQEKLSAVQETIRQYADDAGLFDPLLFPYRNEWGQAETAVLQGKDVATVLADAQRNADAYLACISQKSLAGLDIVQQTKLVQSCYDINQP